MKKSMKFTVTKIVSLIALTLAAAPPAFPEGSVSQDDESQIRQARQVFNQAIRDQDFDAIVQFSAPDYHLISGRSVQIHGKDAVRDLWETYLASAEEVYCQRDTREIRVNTPWGLAEELGDWKCYSSNQGEPVHASGVYAAKWQRSKSNQWLIQSEVFTTMGCDGPETGCKPPAAID